MNGYIRNPLREETTVHYVTHFTHFLALLARSRSPSFHNSQPKSGTHLLQIDTKPCYVLFDLNTEQKLNLTFQGSFASLSIGSFTYYSGEILNNFARDAQ